MSDESPSNALQPLALQTSRSDEHHKSFRKLACEETMRRSPPQFHQSGGPKSVFYQHSDLEGAYRNCASLR
jgi:hypothetical protein